MLTEFSEPHIMLVDPSCNFSNLRPALDIFDTIPTSRIPGLVSGW